MTGEPVQDKLDGSTDERSRYAIFIIGRVYHLINHDMYSVCISSIKVTVMEVRPSAANACKGTM